MLYNTIGLPLFDYCSSVCNSYGVGNKVYLEKLNRRAACIVEHEDRSVDADELKSTFSWPSLQARREYLKCVLVYKCLHGMELRLSLNAILSNNNWTIIDILFVVLTHMFSLV